MSGKMKMIKCSECGEIENWQPEGTEFVCERCKNRVKFAAEAEVFSAQIAAEEQVPYVEDTTNADLAREAARQLTYDPDLARQQSGPDRIEIESHWYQGMSNPTMASPRRGPDHHNHRRSEMKRHNWRLIETREWSDGNGHIATEQCTECDGWPAPASATGARKRRGAEITTPTRRQTKIAFARE